MSFWHPLWNEIRQPLHLNVWKMALVSCCSTLKRPQSFLWPLDEPWSAGRVTDGSMHQPRRHPPLRIRHEMGCWAALKADSLPFEQWRLLLHPKRPFAVDSGSLKHCDFHCQNAALVFRHPRETPVVTSDVWNSLLKVRWHCQGVFSVYTQTVFVGGLLDWGNSVSLALSYQKHNPICDILWSLWFGHGLRSSREGD